MKLITALLLVATPLVMAQVPNTAVDGEPVPVPAIDAPTTSTLPDVPNPDGCRGFFAGFRVVDIQQQGCIFSEVVVEKGTSVWTCPTQIMVLCPLGAYGKFAE